MATSTFVLRGRRGSYSTGLALVTRLGVGGRREKNKKNVYMCVFPFFSAQIACFVFVVSFLVRSLFSCFLLSP